MSSQLYKGTLINYFSVSYFSDGAASQYKRFRSLINLMYHDHDFNLAAEHHLFCKFAQERLMRWDWRDYKKRSCIQKSDFDTRTVLPLDYEKHEWCGNGVTEDGIISHEKRYELKIRYNEVQTIPGTRNYHCFILDGDSLIIKRISNNTMNDFCKSRDPKLLRNKLTTRQIHCMLL